MITRRAVFERLFAAAAGAAITPRLIAGPSANAGARLVRAGPEWHRVKCLSFDIFPSQPVVLNYFYPPIKPRDGRICIEGLHKIYGSAVLGLKFIFRDYTALLPHVPRITEIQMVVAVSKWHCPADGRRTEISFALMDAHTPFPIGFELYTLPARYWGG